MVTRIFLAGGTGVLGRNLIPRLVAAGHSVAATTRRPDQTAVIEALGAQPVVVDALDPDALGDAVVSVRPETVLHMLTDLGAFDWAANNRLRIEGTRNLVDAAVAAGARRIVAQSLSFAYVDGDTPATEDEPLDLDAPEPRRSTLAAVAFLEAEIARVPEPIVLRFGTLYGPGTWWAPDGAFADSVRRREFVADDSVTSFIHVDDAADAIVAALEWPAGTVANVTEDEPITRRIWLPAYARSLGAPAPPTVDGRERGERGARNDLARAFGWSPRHMFPG